MIKTINKEEIVVTNKATEKLGKFTEVTAPTPPISNGEDLFRKRPSKFGREVEEEIKPVIDLKPNLPAVKAPPSVFEFKKPSLFSAANQPSGLFKSSLPRFTAEPVKPAASV